MKRSICLILASAVLWVAPLAAQTTTPPLPVNTNAATVLDFLGATSTNWYVAPYVIYDSGSQSTGGGLGLAYALAEGIVMPTLRMEYLDESIWLASGSLELRPPQKLLGKFPLTPFGVAGVKTAIGGKGADNGTAIGFAGFGAVAKIGKNWGIIGDAEKTFSGGWSAWQFRLGAYIRL